MEMLVELCRLEHMQNFLHRKMKNVLYVTGFPNCKDHENFQASEEVCWPAVHGLHSQEQLEGTLGSNKYWLLQEQYASH